MASHPKETKFMSPSLSWIWTYLPGRDVFGLEDSGSSSCHDGFFDASSSTKDRITAPTETTGLLLSSRASGPHKGSYDPTPRRPCLGSFSSSCSDFIETPQSVHAKLKELQAELDQFPPQSTTIYRYLQQQQQQQQLQQENSTATSPTNNEYLPSLQVLMLRSEQWVVSKAVARFLRFLDAKLQWFGPKALCRPLFPTMTEITPISAAASGFRNGLSVHNVDQLYLWSGIFQVLEACEAKQGRCVLVIFPSLVETVMGTTSDALSLVDLIKAWWYFVAIIVERNERRKQNRLKFVTVIYHLPTTTGTKTRRNLGGTSPPTWTDVNIPLVYWNGLCSLQQLPLSIDEWHCCHDGESTMWIQPQPHSSFSSALVSQRTERTTTDGRRHFHFHQGSQTECLYKLLQCGIPAGDLPLNDDGIIDVTRHHQWMRDAVGVTTSL